MHVLDPGHKYDLDILDGDETAHEHVRLQFVKRIGKKFPRNLGPAEPGVTSQEVMRALINRIQYVNNQMPDVRNHVVINSLRESIFLFEQRAAELHGCVMKNTPVDIENCPVDKNNGHLTQYWVRRNRDEMFKVETEPCITR